jgi:hypothetical protein
MFKRRSFRKVAFAYREYRALALAGLGGVPFAMLDGFEQLRFVSVDQDEWTW